MPRPSNYRRSDSKAGKHVYHDLPQEVKIARETNRRCPLGKNISRIHETRAPRLSTSPSSNSPISKEAARSMKIERKTALGKLNKEKDSSANLKELIESSIKTAMLSVADECRLGFQKKKGRLDETKTVKMERRKSRSRHKGLIRSGQDKESLCHRSRSVYTRSHPTKEQEKSRKSVDRNKHSKNRAKSEDTRITDNRQMTGNVNIFICSEATDVSQARNKPPDPPPSTDTRETTSFSTSEISNSQVDQSTTSSSLLESDRTNQKTENQSSQSYKSKENTGSEITTPTSPQNPEDYTKQLKLESKITAINRSKEPVESAQSIVNVDQSNARNLRRYYPNVDKSDLSFFNSTILSSKNLASSPLNEPPSLKSNVQVPIPRRNQRSPDWRRQKDSPRKFCYTRNSKLVLNRNDECTRRHCKRKFVPCPFLGPEKRSLLCSACNRCPVQEESLDFIENTSNYCRELQTRMSMNVCNKGDANSYRNIKKSERLAQEHVTSIVEYAGDIGRVEASVIADSKNLDGSKSKRNEEREIRKASAIDAIDVKEANDVQNVPTKVINVKQTTDALENEKLDKEKVKSDKVKGKLTAGVPENEKLEKEKVESGEVEGKLTILVESRAKENDQLPKKPEPPPQPPKVQTPINNPTKQKLLKLVRGIDRKNIAKSTKINPESPRVTSRPTLTKVRQVKSPVVKSKIPQKVNSIRVPLQKGQKQIGAKAMKESAKRFIRAKAGIPKASGSRGKRADVRENKQMQSRQAASTKNMQSKQTMKKNDSKTARPKSFKERLRASLFCRTMLKVLNRLKCRSTKEARKGESKEKSSLSTAFTEEDNRAAKSDANSQSRIRASRQDRRQVRSVVRRPAVSRPADNKKHTTATGFPAKKQKTPQDKKDAPSDVTATDNLAIVDRLMEAEKKDTDPNSRGRVKPKLLTSIAIKRTSLQTGQKVFPGSKKIEGEEKPQESESKVDDEASKGETVKDSGFVRIEKEQMKIPIEDTISKEPDFHAPKSKDPPEPTETKQGKVLLSEEVESIVEPKMETKPARQSVVAKDKIESESVEVGVPQSGATKVDTGVTHAPAAMQVPPQTTHIPEIIQHEAKVSADICDHSKCSHYPKSCLKRPKKLSERETQDCECRMGNVYLERRPRVDARCEYGGCQKRDGNRRHEGALNYGDSISRRERHRCRRTLVCLYCDRPRSNCICRTPRLCACCKLSGEICNCQDQEKSYYQRIPVPNKATFSKANRELQHLKKNTAKYEGSIIEECRCHERIKYPQSNNPPYDQSSLEYDITKDRFCQVCGKAPCTCDSTAKIDDRSKAHKNPRDTLNTQAQFDNKIAIKCKCDYCLPASECKYQRIQQVKQIKSKCCYSESSVCT